MSLAMTAALIDNIDDNNNNNNIVSRKSQHNRTQKRTIDTIDSDKVKSVIQTIHNQQNNDNDDLTDYKPLNPLNPPQMMRDKKEGLTNLEKTMNNTVSVPKPIDNENNILHSLQNTFMNDDEVRRYYNRLVANYQENREPVIHNKYVPTNIISNTNTNMNNNNQILIDKLNYMINLLEEKQDERTNNVTEEVILYSFLGIFIIFVVDSFARVGKYVR
jgi:hypothetical protein